MRALKIATLAAIVLGGVVAFALAADLPTHEARAVTIAFLAGIAVAFVVPRLWRWADRPN